MTAQEVHVTKAIGEVLQAWLTVQQALRIELEQLTHLTGLGATHGPLSPQAQLAEAAYRVSTEQRAAATAMHARAAEEFLQALEALRGAAGN